PSAHARDPLRTRSRLRGIVASAERPSQRTSCRRSLLERPHTPCVEALVSAAVNLGDVDDCQPWKGNQPFLGRRVFVWCKPGDTVCAGPRQCGEKLLVGEVSMDPA